jgi:hypothetical protein
MELITILLFILYAYGFGFIATFFFKNSDNFLERNIMRLGIGLGVFVLFGTILNFLHIPIDYRIFLAISLIATVYSFIIALINKRFSLPKLDKDQQIELGSGEAPRLRDFVEAVHNLTGSKTELLFGQIPGSTLQGSVSKYWAA